MKIYTRTGDLGETGLLGGVRVSKCHLAIRACGELDETNSHLGLARSHVLPDDVDDVVALLQHDLFVLGSQIAAGFASRARSAPALPVNRVAEWERKIDELVAQLPRLDAFILPGGSVAGAQLHVARTVCRRAERCLVELTQNSEPGNLLEEGLVYLNRLSDLLFVLARYVNYRNESPEIQWLPAAMGASSNEPADSSE